MTNTAVIHRRSLVKSRLSAGENLWAWSAYAFLPCGGIWRGKPVKNGCKDMNVWMIIGLVLTVAMILGLSIYSGTKFKAGASKNGSAITAGIIMGTLVGGSSTVGTAQLAYNYGMSAWWFTLGGGIACLADVLQLSPQVWAHHVPKILRVHQAHQPVIVGHDQPAVYGVHPLDGKLHGPAAVQHTGRRVDGVDFFRRHGHLREGGELGVGEETGEVGHGCHLTIALNRQFSFHLF